MRKKAIVVESLMRILMAVGLVVFSVAAGAAIVKNLMPAKDETYLKRLALTINELGDGEVRPLLVGFNEKNALFGFNKNAQEFICVNCFSDTKGESILLKKPSNKECLSTSCVCLCYDISLPKESKETRQDYGKVYELGCKRTSCVSLESSINQKLHPYYQYAQQGTTNPEFDTGALPVKESYWENGFFFVSPKTIDRAMLSSKITKQTGKYELLIHKKKSGGELIAAVCPNWEGMNPNCALS